MLIVLVVAVVAVAALAVWRPWSSPGRKQWVSAPPVPASPTTSERAWLNELSGWIAFVRDAREDPTNLAVRSCGSRLGHLGAPPKRLAGTEALARDTCGALTAQAVDRRASDMSWDAHRAGKANDEEREANHDLRLLLGSLKFQVPPGGHVVPAYSRIAQQLSGGDATVRCWDNRANWEAVSASMARTEPRMRHLLGFAVPWQRRIELSPSVCSSLATIRAGHAPIEAIEVLTHESEHLVGPDGISNEAKTDCYAAQRMYLTGKALGASPARVRAGARLYLRFMQPLLPPEYRSRECRPGGAYDLTPGDGRWP